MSGWTAEQDRDLLLTMIAEHPPTKGDWATISAKFGHGKTSEACRQHFAKLLKSKTTSSDTTDSATTEAPKTTRGVAKKVPNPKKRKAEAVTTEDGADGSADQEDVEDEDVKNTLDAGKAVAKAKAAVKGGAAKEKAAGKIKAEPKPKATRAKKVKTEDGGLKTENHDGDEAVGGAASGEGGKSE